nr:MAG TPA: hypothetical protein [Caudoviricetes sp.]
MYIIYFLTYRWFFMQVANARQRLHSSLSGLFICIFNTFYV